MSEILFRFPITASPSEIFEAITTASGLDCWWTLSAAGTAGPNAIMQFGFGPEFQSQARVSEFDQFVFWVFGRPFDGGFYGRPRKCDQA